MSKVNVGYTRKNGCESYAEYRDRYDAISYDDGEDDGGCGARYEDVHRAAKRTVRINYNRYRYEQD